MYRICCILGLEINKRKPMTEFKKLVEQNGLNMRRWAEILGESHNTLFNWSTGRTKPPKEAIAKLTRLSKQINKIFKETET